MNGPLARAIVAELGAFDVSAREGRLIWMWMGAFDVRLAQRLLPGQDVRKPFQAGRFGRRVGRRRRCYGWPAALCRPATGHLRAGHRFPAAGYPPASGRHYSRLASGLYQPLTRHLLPAGTGSAAGRARPGRSGPPVRHLGTGAILGGARHAGQCRSTRRRSRFVPRAPTSSRSPRRRSDRLAARRFRDLSRLNLGARGPDRADQAAERRSGAAGGRLRRRSTADCRCGAAIGDHAGGRISRLPVL
jgi:hypothetical protein